MGTLTFTTSSRDAKKHYCSACGIFCEYANSNGCCMVTACNKSFTYGVEVVEEHDPCRVDECNNPKEKNVRVIEKKILVPFADAVLSGDKTFEIRKNEEGYQKGDILKFIVVDDKGFSSVYDTHPLNDIKYEITYVLSGWGLKEDYVALGIKQFEE